MRVNYLGLEAFVAVAELGSFSRAAEKLNLSQTALSHRIRKIEEELGVRLLARTSRDVALTKSGEMILPQVKAQLGSLASLMGSIQQAGRERKRRLVFACLPTLANHHLPAILDGLAAEMPGLDIVLRDQSADSIIDLVRADEVEFGITILGVGHWDLDAEPLAVEPYHLIVARGHRLAGQGAVRLDDLAGEAMVRIRTQFTNRALVDMALAPVRDRIRWRYEVNNAAMALSLVAAGAAVTVLPRLAAWQAADRVVGLPFADAAVSRQIGIVSRRGMPLSGPALRLIGQLRTRLDAEAQAAP